MRIWIIGNTQSGKSTLAQVIAKKFKKEMPIVETSRFIRGLYPNSTTELLTEKSLELLKQDHKFFSKKIEEDVKDLHDCIIVGSRNPTDFINLFNPKEDQVIFLGGLPSTQFEQYGIATIRLYIDFLVTSNLFDQNNAFFLNKEDFDKYDGKKSS